MSVPSIPQLKDIYAKGISLNQVDRLRSLTEALTWYESSIPFHRHSFDKDTEAKFQRAMKAGNLGRGGRTADEQETGLRMAIKLFEKTLLKLNPPSVEVALYETLEERRPELEAKRAKAETRVKDELAALRLAYGSLGLAFAVDPAATRPRSFDANGNMIYSSSHLETARLPQYGTLAVVLNELEAALKASAIDKDSQGNPVLNQGRMINNLGKALSGIRSWLNGQPQAFADPAQVGQVAPPSTPKPTTPRPSQKKAAGATGANPYRGMKGMIFDSLCAHAGSWTRMFDIMQGIPAKDPRRMLDHIAQDGRSNGLWSLQIQKSGLLLFEKR